MHQLAPKRQKRFRDRFLYIDFPAGIHGKYKMRIRMYKSGHLPAGLAFAAGVSVMPVLAVQILDIRQSERQGAAAFVFIQKHGMADPARVSHGHHRFF